jgi:hypothetical protein
MKHIFSFILNKVIGRINWTGLRYYLTGKEFNMTDGEMDKVVKILSAGRYICLSRRSSHITTYMIGFAHFLLTVVSKFYKAQMGYWSHVFMHIESGSDLDIIESIGAGVVRTNYYRALNVDSVCILKPKYYNEKELEVANELAIKYLGALYDTAFDINDDSRLSCVELAYRCLIRSKPSGLPGLSKMIKQSGNLTPQMFYDCGDFEIVYEMRG